MRDERVTVSSWAVAFPGQGVDLGMLRAALRDLAAHELVRDLAERHGVSSWDDADLRDTRIAQPAVFLTGAVPAIERAAAARVVIGHSLGEITALAAAGAVSVDAGYDLVRRRAELAHASERVRAGRMAAVMGLSVDDVEFVRRRVCGELDRILDVAGVNGRQQVVLSGDADAIERAGGLVTAAGGLLNVLPIGGGFHSALMAGVADRFRDALAAVTIAEPAVEWRSTIDLQAHDDGEDIRDMLARALLLPVRWLEALEALRSDGVEGLIDAGPGETLRKLVRRLGFMQLGSLVDLDAVGER